MAVNGEAVADVTPGTYCRIERQWFDEDTIEIDLDMAPHFWPGDNERAGLTSIYRGPILLAYDQRYNRELQRDVEPAVFGFDPWKTTAEGLQVPALDAAVLTPTVWDDWLPPMLLFEVFATDGRRVRLCDFASAGQTGSLYRSWLPVRRCA